MNSGGTKSDAHGTAQADTAGEDGLSSRLQYQEAFEFAADPQIITDGSGLILEANHAAVTLLRRVKEFLIGKPLALFSVEGYRSRFYESLARLAHGFSSDTFQSLLARRGESPREVSILVRAGEASGAAIDAHHKPSYAELRHHWIVRDVTEWKRSEDARAELQRRLAKSQEDERRRIARDLHDTVAQTLTALSLGVRAVRDSAELPAATLPKLDQVQRLADELARQLHDLATRLRPAALDDLGLEAAVQQLVSDWSTHAGVPTELQVIGLKDQRLASEIETALYRIVQEALTNIAKHAGARRVAVVVGESARQAVAVIEDDGVGFDLEGVSQTPSGRQPSDRERLGLLGMRERVTLVGGTLEIESTPGQGTTVIARIPLDG